MMDRRWTSIQSEATVQSGDFIILTKMVQECEKSNHRGNQAKTEKRI